MNKLITDSSLSHIVYLQIWQKNYITIPDNEFVCREHLELKETKGSRYKFMTFEHLP